MVTFIDGEWFVLLAGVVEPGAFAVAHVLTDPVAWESGGWMMMMMTMMTICGKCAVHAFSDDN